MSPEIYLLGPCRTAIGKFGGALQAVPPADLAAHVVTAALRRAGVTGEVVDEVLFGHVLQAGHGFNVARQAALGAGLPVSVPGSTINMVCGSGLRAIIDAARVIAAGEAEVVVAGGVESMSRAPYLAPTARWGARLGHTELVDTLLRDGLVDPAGYHMGQTAENLARRFGLSRLAQEEFAVETQQRHAAATARGDWAAEIEPLEVGGGLFAADEHPRPDVTLAGLARLKPAFEAAGTVTAGTASGVCDGAAALVVASAAAVERLGVQPVARLRGWAYAGCEPECMGRGPALAVPKLLARHGLQLADFTAVEVNEAFAAQVLAVIQELGLARETVNQFGGAIALGHPLGASGARIVVTLLNVLQRQGGGLGLATLCCGGGMGVALAVETTG